MPTTNEILKEAMELPPVDKAELIDKLLSSLDRPDRDLDDLWAKEAESRIDAYERGELKTIDLDLVMAKYRR